MIERSEGARYGTCTSFGTAHMFDYRKIALWLVVLLVPGGILLLPVLIATMRRRPAAAPTSETSETPEAPSSGPL